MKKNIVAALFVLAVLMTPLYARAACTSPVAPVGKIIYNSSQKIFQYCANTAWVRMTAAPGTGSGGCTSPVRAEGAVIYNQTQGMMQGCAGNVWLGLSPWQLRPAR
jgi:hypothetical protein